MLLLALLNAGTIQSIPARGELNMSCIKRGREALLKFKQGLEDPIHHLSSWVGNDCCRWQGVECSNRTGHVVKLDLQNLYPFDIESDDEIFYPLSGEINPSLPELKHLTYLDLSLNDFGSQPIPKFIGSFKRLRYLNLSTPNNKVNSLDWLSHLSSMQYLDMLMVNLSQSNDWLQVINELPNLSTLFLSRCFLPKISTSLPCVNFTSLSTLDLSYSDLGASLQCTVPIDLHSLCNLHSLDLSWNGIGREIAGVIGCLSGCRKRWLENLNLAGNQLGGHFPDWLLQHKNLKYLDLSWNSLHGHIPGFIGRLPSLRVIDLSYNQLNGTLHKSWTAL